MYLHVVNANNVGFSAHPSYRSSFGFCLSRSFSSHLIHVSSSSSSSSTIIVIIVDTVALFYFSYVFFCLLYLLSPSLVSFVVMTLLIAVPVYSLLFSASIFQWTTSLCACIFLPRVLIYFCVNVVSSDLDSHFIVATCMHREQTIQKQQTKKRVLMNCIR